MLIRLYFLLPDAELARNIVNELSDNNILPSHIYAHCRNTFQLTRLPRAGAWQRHDVLRKIEQVLWRADLLIFLLALAACFTALISGAYLWALVSVVVMSVAFFAGNHFASHVPNVHLIILLRMVYLICCRRICIRCTVPGPQ